MKGERVSMDGDFMAARGPPVFMGIHAGSGGR